MKAKSEQVRVRPVSLARLLDVVDLVAGRDSISSQDLIRSLALSKRRSHELLSTLMRLGFLERANGEFNTTDRLERFVAAWNGGDLRELTAVMRGYDRFNLVLDFLSRCSPVRPPTSVDRELWAFATELFDKSAGMPSAEACYQASLEELRSTDSPSQLQLGWRNESGNILTDAEMSEVLSNLILRECLKLHGEGLNLTEFDTLHRWGIGIGAVYISKGYAYYGAYEPTPEEFAEAVQQQYFSRPDPGNYQEIGSIADEVCKRLGISLPTFERHFADFWRRERRLITLASAVPTHRDRSSEGKFLLPRLVEGPWFELRNPSDGVTIAGHRFTLVRMVRRHERN